MLVCALLIAALAAQPAAGKGKDKDKSAPAAASQAARAPQADVLPNATPRRERGATRGRGRRQAGPPPAAPAAAPGAPAGRGRPGRAGQPLDRAPAEQGARGTPPVMAAAPAQAPPAAVPAAAAQQYPAPPDAASTGAGGGANGGPTEAAPAPGETPAAGAVAVAPTRPASSRRPNTQETATGSGPVAVGGEKTGSAPRRSATARANSSDATGRRSAQASPVTGTSPLIAAGPVARGSQIGSVLGTAATEATTRLRADGRSETSGPRPPAGDAIAPLQGSAGAGASESSSVVEVLASWAKYALAVLALLVLALGANAIVAAGRNRRLERQRERLIEDIGQLQSALLPAVPARLGALLTTVAYRPAEGPAAGGDFYDAFVLPDGRVGLLLGDVSGHGRQALAKTTLVRFTVRAHLEAGLSPREAIAITGRSLDGRLSDDFATVIAAIHDPVNGTLTYASAGHPPPIVVGPPRHRPLTVSSAPPIGVGFPTGQRQTVLPMPEGTSVMIYSDGLLEARIDGVPLGPERLAAWLSELGTEATANAVLDRVVQCADRVPDDLAAVLLHAAPGATAPAERIEQLKLDVLDMDAPDLDGFLRAAGVGEADRLIAGRRVSELLATTSGVIVDVRTGAHPMVGVSPIGDDSGLSTRAGARTR